MIFDKRVKDIVAAEELALAAYVAGVKHNMWASIMEVTYALEMHHANVFLNMGKEGAYCVGDPNRAKYVIHLVKQHFIVEKFAQSALGSKKEYVHMGRANVYIEDEVHEGWYAAATRGTSTSPRTGRST